MTALDVATARGLLLKAIHDPHLLVRLRGVSGSPFDGDLAEMGAAGLVTEGVG